MKTLTGPKTAFLVLVIVLLCNAFFCGLAVWPRWRQRSDAAAQLAAAEQQLEKAVPPTATPPSAAALLQQCAGAATLLGLREQPAAGTFRLEASGDWAALTRFIACMDGGWRAGNLMIVESAGLYTLTLDLALSRSDAEEAQAWIGQVAPSPSPTPLPTPSAAAQLLAELDAAWQAADWPTAIRLSEQLLTIHPDTAAMAEKLYAAHVNYGYQLLGEGRLEESKRAFTAALAVRPDGVEAVDGLRRLSEAAPLPAMEGR